MYFSTEYHPLKEQCFASALANLQKFFSSFGQDFFITDGAALGYYRHNGSIVPHDKDLDVSCFYKDFNEKTFDKFVLKASIKLTDSCQIDSAIKNCIEGQLTHYTLYVNEKINNLQYKTKIDFVLLYEYEKEKDTYYYRASSLFCPNGTCYFYRRIRGLSEVSFLGGQYKCPSNIREYLIDAYGQDFMQEKNLPWWEMNNLRGRKS